jgi:hypothetical protein
VGQVTTNVCRVSALVLCAGLGVALTGAGGTAFIAAMAGSAFGGAAGNFFHQVSDGVLSWFGKKKFDTTALPANHDLDGLTACAIHHVFALARDQLSTDDPKRGVLERLANTPVSTIVAAMQAQDARVVGDAEIVDTLGTAAGGQTTTVSTPELWQSFVEDLLRQTGADQQPSALRTPVRDLNQFFSLTARAIKDATRANFRRNVIPSDADLLSAGKDPAADKGAAFAAGLLHANVAAFANDILRDTFGPQGRFFVAALFNMLNTISANTRQPPPGAKFTVEQIDQIKACLPDAVNAAIAQSRGLPAPADAESLAAAREMQAQAAGLAKTLQGMDAKLDAVREELQVYVELLDERLGRMEVTLTAAAQDAKRGADSAGYLKDEYKKGRLRFASDATDNLTAASATQNNNFVGRTKQLDDLAALIQHPTTPTAVVIVAGAGFGKTELAKQFINTRARPAPAGCDVATLKPNEWTARWWIDGSKGGEAPSLKLHYTTITGQPFPAEPRPAPGEDPAKVEAAFRTKLRKDIASACKTGRQLLVIDNAESTQQINEYKPGNAGRLIATTRKQPIPQAVGHPFPLDVMSPPDSMDLLVSARPDLFATLTAARAADRADPDGVVALRQVNAGESLADPIEAVAAMSEHLGHHALALAYAAAALARPPFETPQAVLATMQAADVGAEGDILAEFDKDALGTQYKMGLAQSLGFLLDELADAASPTHDALAFDLAGLAAFCNPAAIPVSLLVAASSEPEAAVKRSLRALHERSIVTLTDTTNLHRLTQSLVRGRLRRTGGEQGHAALSRLLNALIALFRWPATQAEELLDHTKTPARLAAVVHAESVIVHTEALTPPAGKGAAAPFPGTPSPPEAESGGEPGAKVSGLRAEMAHRLADAGQLADAARHIDAAIAFGESHRPATDLRLHIDYGIRASIRQDRGDLAGAEADIQKSIHWGEAQSPRDERSLAIWYASRASIRQHRGDLAGAEADLKKSIDWGEAQSPRDERSLAVWYASRASIRQHRGDLVGAEDDIKKSIDWGEAQSPRDERSLAIRYASRATIRRVSGDLAGAEADLKKSIKWGEAQSPRNERSLAIRYASRATIRQSRGDLAGAEDDIKKSIDWEESQAQPNQRELAIRYASRARILGDQAIAARRDGDVDGAAALFAKAKADISAALAWWEKNLPHDERTLGIFGEVQARIDKAAEGE